MYSYARINVILNGKQELDKVVNNLKPLFDFGNPVLLMTKSEKSEVFETVGKLLSVDESWINENVAYERFNEVDYTKIAESAKNLKIICIRIPNSLYHTIPTGYNDAIKFIKKTSIAQFGHFFADDCKIISESYDPTVYEWFMTTFNEPFIMDSKLNQGNYAFKKYSPRFVFMSKTYLKQPVSFVQYESKDHFIIDFENVDIKFDEKLKRLYIPELIFRLHKNGIVKHTSFYPDPVLEQWVKRDDTLPFTQNIDEIAKEYSEDEKYLKNVLKVTLLVENAVDPIINEMGEVIKTNLSKTNEIESPKIVIPKLSESKIG